MTDVYVQSFTHLKDRHRADDALKLLQKVASLVKPIMRKRGWILPILAEFFPDNPNLLGLNINMGKKILVRLRPHFDPDTFLPEGDVLYTMLHELTHNVHGLHDDSFYKYLAGLESEYEDLKRSGYSGEGFHSRGVRLGLGTSHNLPPHLARLKALEAAEKRKRADSSGGRRLGSGSGGQAETPGGGGRPLTPRELALRAAERRRHDNMSCASGTDAQREAEKAAKESVESEVIDLTLDSDEEVQVIETISTTGAGPTLSSTSKFRSRTFPESIAQTLRNVEAADEPRPLTSKSPLTNKVRPDPMAQPWTCQICTLVNQPFALLCDACLSPPSRDASSGWICLDCGTQMQTEHWMCSLCGGIKTES